MTVPSSRHKLRFGVVQAVGFALALAIALATAAVESASAASCGSVNEFTGRISTPGVGCRTARTVARQWGRECAQRSSGSCSVTAGFYCRYRDFGVEAGRIRCTSGSRVVRFYTGS